MIFSLDDNSKLDMIQEEHLDASTPDPFDSSVTSAATRTTQNRTSLTVTFLILLSGCAASGAFLGIGAHDALENSQQEFETDVQQLAVRVHNAFREYENAALWVNQFSVSHKDTTLQGIPFPSNFRSLFRSLYDGIVANGLPLHAIQFLPNVTHEERQWYEDDARQFYQQYYPDIAKTYDGLSGFVPDDTAPAGVSLKARPQDDFYFPVHFVEPVLDNIGVIDFDVYSEDYPRWAVNTALDTLQPVITGRLRLIQEPDPSPDRYSVLLMHPGLKGTKPYSNSTQTHRDVSLIAIRIPALLEYIATLEHHHESLGYDSARMPDMKVYLYDTTPGDDTFEDSLYLGGAQIIHHSDEAKTIHLEQLSYIEMAELDHQRFFHKIELEIGMRQWTIACVAEDDTYPPALTFAIVGGVMIFVAFFCLSLWVYTQMNRTVHTSRLKAKAQEERALLRIEHARQAAAAERQLNEFIAHEVRNPLSAAMSALSFVQTIVEESSHELFGPPKSAPPAVKPLFALPSTTKTQLSTSSAPPAVKPLFPLPTTTDAPQAANPQSTPPETSTVPLLDTSKPTQPTPLFEIQPATGVKPLFPLSRADSNPQSKPTEAAPAEAATAPLFDISQPKPLFDLTPSANNGTSQAKPKPLFDLNPDTNQDNLHPQPKPLFDLTPNPNNGNSEAQLKPLFALNPTTNHGNSQSQPQPKPLFEFNSNPNTSKPLFSLPSKTKGPSADMESQQKQEQRQEILSDLHIIDSSLQYINDLLRNMLDVQRAACHQLKIEKGPTDVLRDILEPVDAMLYRRGRNNVDVIIECPDPNLLIEADRLRLKQVVLNLGRNASKFVEKGWIKFKVVIVPVDPSRADGEETEISEQCSSDGSFPQQSVQIWVEDTGVGIPDDKKSMLFAKFQESLDSLSQGTGLGLSLCKILVRLMGGEIWLDETYHSGFDDRPGSRFIIDLHTPPINATEGEVMGDASMMPENEDIETGVSTTNIDAHGMSNGSTRSLQMRKSSKRRESFAVNLPPLPAELSILFVDDDTVLRKLLVRSVRAIAPGWTIHEAASGEAALRAVEEQSFDLIFMDQYMASMQKQLLGTESTTALRAKGVTAKICGLSANEMADDFFAAGANAFVCKPLPTKKALLQQILCEILMGKNPEMVGHTTFVITPGDVEHDEA